MRGDDLMKKLLATLQVETMALHLSIKLQQQQLRPRTWTRWSKHLQGAMQWK
jgi:hypothetical protein